MLALNNCYRCQIQYDPKELLQNYELNASNTHPPLINAERMEYQVKQLKSVLIVFLEVLDARKLFSIAGLFQILLQLKPPTGSNLKRH